MLSDAALQEEDWVQISWMVEFELHAAIQRHAC